MFLPDLFPSWTVFTACSAIVVLGQLIFAAIGFGGGLIIVTLFAFVIPELAPVVVVHFVLTACTELWIFSRTRRHGRPRLLATLVPGAAIGMLLGSFSIATGDVSTLKRALGALVVVAAIWFIVSNRRGLPPKTGLNRIDRAIGLVAGIASGFLGAAFSMGGPPAIIYIRAMRLEKSAFRATLITYFLCLSVLRGSGYVWFELLGRDELLAALWLMPASTLGTVAGMTIHDRVPQRLFEQLVAWALAAIGLTLFVSVGASR